LIDKAFRRPFSDTRVSKNASRVEKPPHAGRGMVKEKWPKKRKMVKEKMVKEKADAD
jgi:hypothetical protein